MDEIISSGGGDSEEVGATLIELEGIVRCYLGTLREVPELKT